MSLTPEGLCFVGENIKSLTELKHVSSGQPSKREKWEMCKKAKNATIFFIFIFLASAASIFCDKAHVGRLLIAIVTYLGREPVLEDFFQQLLSSALAWQTWVPVLLLQAVALCK